MSARFDLRSFCALLFVTALVVGCSGSNVNLTPQPHATSKGSGTAPTPTAPSTSKPSPTATATSSPPPSGGATPNAAAMNATLEAAQDYFYNLPSTGYQSELSALATHLASSGMFAAATVTTGGITATLANGMQVTFYADVQSEQDAPTGGPASSVRPAREARPRRAEGISGASTSHEVAYFINTTDQGGAFVPSRQADLANAWSSVKGVAGNYEVDDIPVGLANISALGSSHPLDMLSLATHGMVALVGAANAPQYINLSDTQISQGTIAIYLTPLLHQQLFMSAVLIRPNNTPFTRTFPSLSFTPQWLASQVTFNPGAYFDNESCFGQYSTIASAVASTYGNAGVASYSGWTYPVGGDYADQTDAFLTDRLLGEPSAALASYVGQRSPLQRPFPLLDILSQMASETRNGGLISPINPYDNHPYTYSPSTNWPAATYVTTPISTLSDALVVPTIETLTVAEGSPSTLTLTGEFSTATGEVDFTPSGGSSAPLAVTSWSPTSIVVTLPPATSSAAGGSFTVTGPTGLQGNAVPLTYWQGAFTYTETSMIKNFGDDNGTGSGGLQIAMQLGIRSDVHPTVPTIDTSPEPQNLFISNVTPNSSGTISDYHGNFASSSNSDTASIVGTADTALAPYAMNDYLELSSSLDAVGGSASCNNGMPGPQGEAGNVACPAFAYSAINDGSCSDNQNGSVCAAALTYRATIGSPTSQFGDDADYDSTPSAFTITMDPSTYALSFSATAGTQGSTNYSDYSAVMSNMTGTFDAPVMPPSTSVRFKGRAKRAVTRAHR